MTDKPVSPLRQRMIEDMTVRHFKEKAVMRSRVKALISDISAASSGATMNRK